MALVERYSIFHGNYGPRDYQHHSTDANDIIMCPELAGGGGGGLVDGGIQALMQIIYVVCLAYTLTVIISKQHKHNKLAAEKLQVVKFDSTTALRHNF